MLECYVFILSYNVEKFNDLCYNINSSIIFNNK